MIYDPAGDLLWEGRYDGPVSGKDEGQAISVNDDQSVYVAGISKGISGDYDIVLIKYTPSFCICPYQGDAEPDGFVTALDLSACIDILFAGSPDLKDADCPIPRFDLDCDGFTTALDLSRLIDHLFAGGAGPCDPCEE